MAVVSIQCPRCSATGSVENGGVGFCESCGELLDDRGGLPSASGPATLEDLDAATHDSTLIGPPPSAPPPSVELVGDASHNETLQAGPGGGVLPPVLPPPGNTNDGAIKRQRTTRPLSSPLVDDLSLGADMLSQPAGSPAGADPLDLGDFELRPPKMSETDELLPPAARPIDLDSSGGFGGSVADQNSTVLAEATSPPPELNEATMISPPPEDDANATLMMTSTPGMSPFSGGAAPIDQDLLAPSPLEIDDPAEQTMLVPPSAAADANATLMASDQDPFARVHDDPLAKPPHVDPVLPPDAVDLGATAGDANARMRLSTDLLGELQRQTSTPPPPSPFPTAKGPIAKGGGAPPSGNVGDSTLLEDLGPPQFANPIAGGAATPSPLAAAPQRPGSIGSLPEPAPLPDSLAPPALSLPPKLPTAALSPLPSAPPPPQPADALASLGLPPSAGYADQETRPAPDALHFDSAPAVAEPPITPIIPSFDPLASHVELERAPLFGSEPAIPLREPATAPAHDALLVDEHSSRMNGGFASGNLSQAGLHSAGSQAELRPGLPTLAPPPRAVSSSAVQTAPAHEALSVPEDSMAPAPFGPALDAASNPPAPFGPASQGPAPSDPAPGAATLPSMDTLPPPDPGSGSQFVVDSVIAPGAGYDDPDGFITAAGPDGGGLTLSPAHPTREDGFHTSPASQGPHSVAPTTRRRQAGARVERPLVVARLVEPHIEGAVRKAALGLPATFKIARVEGDNVLIVRGLLESQANLLKEKLDKANVSVDVMRADELHVGYGAADLRALWVRAKRPLTYMGLGVAAVAFVGGVALGVGRLLDSLGDGSGVSSVSMTDPPPTPADAAGALQILSRLEVGYAGYDQRWWIDRIEKLRLAERAAPTEQRRHLRALLEDTERKARVLGVDFQD